MNMRRDEAGLVGKMIAVWLLVLALLAVAAIDAASIAFTTYKLSDVGAVAASEGARVYKRAHNVRDTCERVAQLLSEEEPSARLTRRVSHRRTDRHRHAEDQEAGEHPGGAPDPMDEEVRPGDRDGNGRATVPVAFATVDASDTDEQLVRRFREGSADAFEVLVHRHGNRVYNLCLRILGDPEEAADASQDTFLAALRKLNTFRGDSAFTTWLHRVTVNACYDSLRRKRRRPLLQVVRDEDDERPEPSLPAPDHADQVVLSVDVAKALMEVPKEFRVVLVMADVQDLPYDEIARVLEIPVGTVKSRMHAAVMRLREVLDARRVR